MPLHDFLVVGSGLAGLNFAVQAARLGRVALVTKRTLEDSNTAWAQGGIAAVWNDDDSIECHVADTLAAGAGLCDAEVVRGVVEEGPGCVAELIRMGVSFSRRDGDDTAYDLGLEGGHTRRRVLHAADHTGREIVAVLSAAVRADPNIDVFEQRNVVDLLIDEKFGLARGHPQCWGAYVLDTTTGEIELFSARATLLATGGAGKVYLYTSNPDVASGDGIAIAHRAGCHVADLEFMQFHPTCLYHPKAKSFLVT